MDKLRIEYYPQRGKRRWKKIRFGSEINFGLFAWHFSFSDRWFSWLHELEIFLAPKIDENVGLDKIRIFFTDQFWFLKVVAGLIFHLVDGIYAISVSKNWVKRFTFWNEIASNMSTKSISLGWRLESTQSVFLARKQSLVLFFIIKLCLRPFCAVQMPIFSLISTEC